MSRRARFATLAALLLFRPSAAATMDDVKVGHAAVDARRLPLGHVEVANWIVTDGRREDTGGTTRTIRAESTKDGRVFVILGRHWTIGGDTTLTRIVVRAADLSLVSHKVTAARDSAAVTATREHLSGWVVLPGTPPRLLDVPLAHPVFPVEGQIPWLFPMLPLAPGYAASLSHFSQWAGGETRDTIRVIGAERLEVVGTALECWVVDAGAMGPPGYRMTRWVDRTSRLVIQSALRGDPAKKAYWSRIRKNTP